jgi:ubiquinone/menaquinone biosynthesis C-methylase UbiE
VLTSFNLQSEQNRLGEQHFELAENYDLISIDLQHQLFLLTLHEKLHLAPLGENVHNVLDIATGTGIWAIDFGAYTFLPATYLSNLLLASRYPSSNVIGTDLSPIQPKLCAVPSQSPTSVEIT